MDALIGTPFGSIPLVVLLTASVVAVAVLFLIVRVYMRRARDTKRRDPRRMFTADERRMGFQRAGNQCEYARWWVWRCTRTAEHGDHFVPWSKGGATSMQNFVAACPRCNTSKGARMPSALDRGVIRARRRQYFPAGLILDAGERFAR